MWIRCLFKISSNVVPACLKTSTAVPPKNKRGAFLSQGVGKGYFNLFLHSLVPEEQSVDKIKKYQLNPFINAIKRYSTTK